MMQQFRILILTSLLSFALCFTNSSLAADSPTPAGTAGDAWSHGPSTDSNYFPIAVWLQNPRNAARYRAAGINLYVGLWRGPTAEQLKQLSDAGIQVICSQNSFALSNKDNPTIAGWMHGDEPDNAQSLGSGKGYGPPVLPEKIAADYTRIRSRDSSRPVLLNLGQGVAWDNYIGRGVRRNRFPSLGRCRMPRRARDNCPGNSGADQQ